MDEAFSLLVEEAVIPWSSATCCSVGEPLSTMLCACRMVDTLDEEIEMLVLGRSVRSESDFFVLGR